MNMTELIITLEIIVCLLLMAGIVKWNERH